MAIPARPTRRSFDGTGDGYGTRANSGMAGLGATGLEYEGRVHDWGESNEADQQIIINDSVVFAYINADGTQIVFGNQGGSQLVELLADYGTDFYWRLQLDNSDPTSTNRRIVFEIWAADGSAYKIVGYKATLPDTWTFSTNTRIGALYFDAPTPIRHLNGHIAFVRCKEGLSPYRQRPTDGPITGTYLYAYDFESDSGADGSGNGRDLTMVDAAWADSPSLPEVSIDAGPDGYAYPGETRKVRCLVHWPDSYTVSHQWSVVSGTATLANDTTETVSVTVGGAGSVVLRDTVTISDGSTSDVLTDEATLTVLASGAALPLMPLGDSITVGNLSTSGSGYRGYLKPLLGSDFDFVGGVETGTVQDGDNQHEGHGGYRAAYGTNNLLDNLRTWLGTTPARDVLLIAGTNDLTVATDEFSAAAVCALAEEIMKFYPSARLYWCYIPFRTDANAGEVATANARIEQYAARLVSRGFAVETIDIVTGFVSGDIGDGIHPVDSGYEKIAYAIFGAGLEGPPLQPSIVVTIGETEIEDEGTHPLGSVGIGVAQAITVTIGNEGLGDLEDVSVSIDAPGSVTTQPAGTIEPEATSDAVFSITPTTSGAFSAVVTIESTDPMTPEFEFTVTGTAIPTQADFGWKSSNRRLEWKA